jgi:ribosome-associated protein
MRQQGGVCGTGTLPLVVPQENGITQMASSDIRSMVLAAAAACDEKKGEDTRVLELDAMDSGFTDFFLITSGTNERQTQAIADEIELRLKRDFGVYANSVEGRRVGEWVLLDYVDFVVHIFLAEKRAYYDIERLRKSAQSVDLAEFKAALTKKTLAARKKSAAKTAAEKTVKKPVKKTAKKVAKKTPVKRAKRTE